MDEVDLADAQWLAVDEAIFDNNPLLAVKIVRQHTGLGLHAAGDVLHSRYRLLRQRSPQRFTITDKEYWSGWFS